MDFEAVLAAWQGSILDIAALADRAAEVVGEQAGATPSVGITLETIGRKVDFDSSEQLRTNVRDDAVDASFRSITVSVDHRHPAEKVQVYCHFGGVGDAVYLSVNGTNRSAVEAAFVQCVEIVDGGKRRFDWPPPRVRLLGRTAGAVSAVILYVAVVVGIGVPGSWVPGGIAIIAGGAASASVVGGLAGRTASRLAPWLEFTEPGQPTAWEAFRAGALSNGERVFWVAVGALVVALINRVV